MRKEWTPEEDAKLIALLTEPNSKRSVKEIAELMQRPKASVKHRGRRLGYSVGKSRVRRHPDSLLDAIVSLTNEGLTQQEIADRLGMAKYSISSLLQKRGKARQIAYWTPEEDEWIKVHFPDRSIRLEGALPGRTVRAICHRANALSIKRPVGKLKGSVGKRRIFDEPLICQQYRELKNLKRVAVLHDAAEATISKVLKRNGITPAPYSQFDEHKEAIIADYRAGKLSMKAMEAKYGFSCDEMREKLKACGEYDPAHKNAFGNKLSPYHCWVKRYGQKEADKRQTENNAATSLRCRGSGNPMYGKTTPQGAGNGWKGWYKDHYFRSLREAVYMISLDREGLTWSSAEKIVIPYTMDGKSRTYRPDYLVGNRLVEVKPVRLHKSPNVTAKRLGAEAYCATRNLVYELIDVPINAQIIYDAMQKGDIRFDRDYEQRFLDYCKTHSGLAIAS